MTSFSILLVLAASFLSFSVVSHGTTVEDSALVRAAIPEKGKCRVNICFALEGSASLTGAQFFSQKRFIRKVVKAISRRNDLQVSGVEYGLVNNVISPVTSDISNFLTLLRDIPFSRAPSNFVAGGLLYCQGQLRKNANDPDKIVLLGSGKADFGGDPVTRAAPFLKSGGDIFAIGVGNFDRDALTAIVGRDSSRVFKLGAKAEDKNILAPFLSKLCGHRVVDEDPMADEPSPTQTAS